MICGSMIELSGSKLVPCGQCKACRINRKRTVVGQMILESMTSEESSSFVTLTYRDARYPENGSLDPDEPRKFINRLRKPENLGPLRYLYVGEYGTKTERAHYHLALFGQPPEKVDPLLPSLWGTKDSGLGLTHTGTITRQSISYIAGYCIKKMGRGHRDLAGRYPEFNRRSRFPPLGAEGVYRILDACYTGAGAAALADTGDVPSSFRFEGKLYPISRYWREYLRKELGITNPPQYQPWAIGAEEFLKDAKKASERLPKLDRETERADKRRKI